MGARRSTSLAEQAVKDKIKALLISYKPRVTYFMPSASIYGKRGVSDFIVCANGQFLAVEAKSSDRGVKGMTPMQEHFFGNISDAGGMTMCISNSQDLDKLNTLITNLLK